MDDQNPTPAQAAASLPTSNTHMSVALLIVLIFIVAVAIILYFIARTGGSGIPQIAQTVNSTLTTTVLKAPVSTQNTILNNTNSSAAPPAPPTP